MAYVPSPSNQWNRPHKCFSSNFCRYNEIFRFIRISLVTTEACLSGTIHNRYEVHSKILRTVSYNSHVCCVLGSRSSVVEVFDLLRCYETSMCSLLLTFCESG